MLDVGYYVVVVQRHNNTAILVASTYRVICATKFVAH
jgi:hypothetical protein